MAQDTITELTQSALVRSSCLVFLRHGTEWTEIDWQRLKYGCTCEECRSGFLSPRKLFGFEWEMELLSDLHGQSIEDGSFLVGDNNTFLTFLRTCEEWPESWSFNEAWLHETLWPYRYLSPSVCLSTGYKKFQNIGTMMNLVLPASCVDTRKCHPFGPKDLFDHQVHNLDGIIIRIWIFRFDY